MLEILQISRPKTTMVAISDISEPAMEYLTV